MPNCLFIADAPTTLAEGDSATSRVQIAKTGRFKDPRYGTFSITRQDFSKWMGNFKELSLGGDRAGLPVDVDHGPEKRGDTEAAGWIIGLDTLGRDGKSSTPDELWAVVEWNTLGVKLVGEKRYRYLSPSYQHDYKDEAGRSHGTALVGVGLTNRPFLSMATVSLSAAPLLAQADDSEDAAAAAAERRSSDSRGAMALSKQIAEALGLPEDASDEKALEAISAFQARPESQKTLDELAKETGQVVLSSADYATLAQGAASGVESAKQLSQMRFDTAWDKALEKTRVLPAQKETFEALFGKDADATLKLLDELPEGQVNTEAKGSAGGDAAGADPALAREAEGYALDDNVVELHNRTVALMREHKIDYADALVRAEAELGA